MGTKKALSLFTRGGRQYVLEGRYVVQGVPITLEYSEDCYRQDIVQVRLPSSWRESWGEDIQLPNDIRVITAGQLDEAVLAFFNRWADALVPCPVCGAMTWNRKHFHSKYRDGRCSDCWFTDFDKRVAEWKGEGMSHTRDVERYHAGMRYRVSYAVTRQDGDRALVDLYFVEKPADDELSAALYAKHPKAAKVELLEVAPLHSH